MVYKIFLPASEIAAIIFDGAETYTDIGSTLGSKPRSRVLTKFFEHFSNYVDCFFAQDDRHSLRRAMEKLSRIGYDDGQKAMFREIIKSGIEYRLNKKAQDGAAPLLDFNDSYYLGVRIDGKPLERRSEIVNCLREAFTRDLDGVQERGKGLLFTNYRNTTDPDAPSPQL